MTGKKKYKNQFDHESPFPTTYRDSLPPAPLAVPMREAAIVTRLSNVDASVEMSSEAPQGGDLSLTQEQRGRLEAETTRIDQLSYFIFALCAALLAYLLPSSHDLKGLEGHTMLQWAVLVACIPFLFGAVAAFRGFADDRYVQAMKKVFASKEKMQVFDQWVLQTTIDPNRLVKEHPGKVRSLAWALGWSAIGLLLFILVFASS